MKNVKEIVLVKIPIVRIGLFLFTDIVIDSSTKLRKISGKHKARAIDKLGKDTILMRSYRQIPFCITRISCLELIIFNNLNIFVQDTSDLSLEYHVPFSL